MVGLAEGKEKPSVVAGPRTQNSNTPEQASAQREYQQYATTDDGKHSTTEEPDVLLDVPVLKVGSINLEVRGLRARVAVLADLANFVNLSVGVDARLEEVKLEVEDVEAQALLKVRLSGRPPKRRKAPWGRWQGGAVRAPREPRGKPERARSKLRPPPSGRPRS